MKSGGGDSSGGAQPAEPRLGKGLGKGGKGKGSGGKGLGGKGLGGKGLGGKGMGGKSSEDTKPKEESSE